MTRASFIHLRNHSAYSLSQGAIRVAEMVRLAVEMDMPAIALTDTGNLFGALEFSQACSAKGVQPIIGCQISLPSDQARSLGAPETLVCLARNEAGLANLNALSSMGFMQGDSSNPTVSLDHLCAHAEGIFLLTGGTRGPLFRRLREGRAAEAKALLDRLQHSFGENLAVELNRHGLPEETAVEPGLIALADQCGAALAATNECFFTTPEMHEAHDALLCIAQGRTIAEQERARVTQEHWFKPPAQMRSLFSDLPEACDNTLIIAQRCAVKVTVRAPMLPTCVKVRGASTEEDALRVLAREGLARRLAHASKDGVAQKTYGARLEMELEIIARMGFAGYFLIVADFIQWAKERDIPVGPGRGSGAGSLVAWALTITDIDPIPFNLLFERFLNPERVSMPDFDIDFCQDRRDEVIRYVRQEYGPERVAQIITFGKLQARAAVRDVGRVMGLPFGMVNRVAELIPNNPAKPVTLRQAIDGEPRLQEMRDHDETLARLLDVALQLEGLYRHASTHAAGVVIGDRPLVELVPLYRDPKSDMLVTQYNMKFVEQAGLVKFDFLGLTTLTILKRGQEFIKDQGVDVDIARIPLDDPATYAMLARGDSAGVFQFEGAGMRDVLKQMRPSRIEDLIAAVALYRPGPMAHIPEYCQRKHGAAWEPPHESIREILAETYGIMVYQEQVMQIAQSMAGFSLGAADLLRRAMGKKIRAEMDQQRAIFVQGATERGITPSKAAEVFDLMARFADYGFNKSHAAAYALVSYQTAWMKANYPVAFLAGCMSLALEKTPKLAALLQEARRMKIDVLPVDINHSSADFTLEKTPDGQYAVRYALAAIKRVGFSAMQSIVEARGDRPFKSFADFAARCDARQLNKAQLENLAKAGAFDSILPDRQRSFAAADSIIRRAQACAEEASAGQIGLFVEATETEELRIAAIKQPWTTFERLAAEAEAIGFHMTAHPLDAYRMMINRMGVLSSQSLQTAVAAGNSRVKIAGCVVDRKERPTKSGSKMAWVRLSDPMGSFEVTLFAEVLSRCRDLLVAGRAVLVTADARLEGEALRISATDVVDLEQVAAQEASELRVWIQETNALSALKDELGSIEGGRGRVVLIPQLSEHEGVEIALRGSYRVTPQFGERLRAIRGIERLEYRYDTLRR